jgi:hypothetical protein
MKRAGFLLVHLIVLGLSRPIYGEQPNKPEDRMFTLGTPQCVKEKNSDDTYTIVVPIQVRMPEQFEKPGLKTAYVIFNKAMKSPPDDLKSDETTINLYTDKNGTKDLRWQVGSAQQSVTGQAHAYLGAPPYKSLGRKGVVRFAFRGLPDKDIGLFIIDKIQPASNVLIFRKSDFVAGDGDAIFKAAAAKIQ